MSTHENTFEADIVKMNEMYELGKITTPTDAVFRLINFNDILLEECKELSEIQVYDAAGKNVRDFYDVRTELADLLGDIVVYCASEAFRWNIPLLEVLAIIMQSNFSKLGEDGKPIKDERGKFLKGPNYFKPEPKIRELLESQDSPGTCIHIDSTEKHAGIPNLGEAAACTKPECPGREQWEHGYGLAGGGMGSYNYCRKCELIVEKTLDPIEDHVEGE